MSKRRRKQSNVIKYKRTGFSIGSVLFVIILLYIVFVSVHFLRKDPISIFEVTEKQIYDDNETVGIALRQEEVYTADSTGYIGFYNSNKSKIAKGATIYTLDKSGTYKDELSQITDSSDISAENISGIRTEIASFQNNFDYSDYSSINNFKYSLESSVLALVSDKLINKLSQTVQNTGGSSFSMYNAGTSGIITYWADGLEGITEDSISEDCFDESTHEKIQLKTSDSVSSGENVCKIVTDEHWNIVIKIDEKQKRKLEEKDSVKIRFAKDNFETTVTYRLFSKDGNDYASLSLNKYMSRYLDDRYIKLELILNYAEGLKIPVSSIIEKNCYIIPVQYLQKGGENSRESLEYIVTDENGEKSAHNIDTFAYKDDNYVYVDAMIITPGTQISVPGTDKTEAVQEIKPLKGVYNVNEGYCEFKHIEIIYENKEYCIVKKDMEYGLSAYDHIVINPEKINEDDIIY